MPKLIFALFAAILALTSNGALAARAAKIELPRLGLETETAMRNSNDQVISAPSDIERKQQTKKVLEFWRNIFGGDVRKNSSGIWHLDPGSDRVGWFWVDDEWASDLRSPDGYEFVTPPLDPKEVDILVDKYDEFLKETRLGPGIKTSQQFNMELRNLIDGFSLKERPSQKMGMAYKDIAKVNIDRVVNLFLYLELNLIKIYAAYSPRRLGFLVNYFSMPFSFELPGLLHRLAEMPKAERTYENVRNVFLEFSAEEESAAKFGNRTEWKYRTFNIRKFFALNEANPTWVYPALEIRIPDTPENSSELRRQLNLTYALFARGALARVSASDIDNSYTQYRKFWQKYKYRLSFEKAIRIVNQDIVSQSLTSHFRIDYAQFLNDLKLSEEDYPPFRGAEPSPFISQTYGVFGLIGNKEEVSYAGRTVQVSKIRIPWDLTGVSFGAECEFSHSPQLLATLRQVPFLEPEVTVEKTGNREVITKPTTDLVTFLTQLQYQRDILGDSLKGMHLNLRISKDIYKEIPKQKFDAWISRIGDWISVIRANYRNPKYAFRTRTQNRMQASTPNAWIGDDKAEYRGTVRVYSVGDQLNIEFRGLMDGIYSQVPLEPDLFTVVLLTFLKGINEPDLIEGDLSHRLLTEVQDPSESFNDVMTKFAEARGESLSKTVHSAKDLVSAVRLPNLMLLPLMGFEFLPLISGHDIRRMQYANTNWKHEVWKILNDASLSKEAAQDKFVETLKKWSRDSSLESALFDSLLVSPALGLSWADLHLPAKRARPAFLRKILTLSSSEFDKPAFDLFAITWSQKDLNSLAEASANLPEVLRQGLGNLILTHESPNRSRTILKTLGIKLNSNGNQSRLSTSLQTNLLLLTRENEEVDAEPPKIATEGISPPEDQNSIPFTEDRVPIARNNSIPSPQSEARGWFRQFLDRSQYDSFITNYDFALGQLETNGSVEWGRYLNLIKDADRVMKTPNSQESILLLLQPFKGLFDNTDNIFLPHLHKYEHRENAMLSLKLRWLLTPPAKRISDFKMYFSEMKSVVTPTHYAFSFILWALPTLNESDRRELSLFANAAFTKVLLNDSDWMQKSLTHQLNINVGVAIRFYQSVEMDPQTQATIQKHLKTLPAQTSLEILKSAIYLSEAVGSAREQLGSLVESRLGPLIFERRNTHLSSPPLGYNYQLAQLVFRFSSPSWLDVRSKEDQAVIRPALQSIQIPKSVSINAKDLLTSVELFEACVRWNIPPEKWTPQFLQFAEQVNFQSHLKEFERLTPAIDLVAENARGRLNKSEIAQLLRKRWLLTHDLEKLAFVQKIFSSISFEDLFKSGASYDLNLLTPKWGYLDFFADVFNGLPEQFRDEVAGPIRKLIITHLALSFSSETKAYLSRALHFISTREQIDSALKDNAMMMHLSQRAGAYNDIHRLESVVEVSRLLGYEKFEIAAIIESMMSKAALKYQEVGHLNYTEPLAKLADEYMPDEWFVDWSNRLALLKKYGSTGRYQRLLRLSSTSCQDILSHYR